MHDKQTENVIENVPIQEYEEGGLVDADVCWGSRHVPSPKGGLLTDFGGFFDKSNEVSAKGAGCGAEEEGCVWEGNTVEDYYPLSRGKEQWADIDWSRYYIDSGTL
jgi:hypothetical protein